MKSKQARSRIDHSKLFLAMIVFFLLLEITLNSVAFQKSSEDIGVKPSKHSKLAARSSFPSDTKPIRVWNNSREVVTFDNETGTNAGFFSMLITEDDIERLSVTLPELLPNYKNPCWIEMVPRNFSYFTDAFYYKYYLNNRKYRPHGDWNSTFIKMQALLEARKEMNSLRRAWRMRCFPYFFIPGFTKGGTSDLYKTLMLFRDFVPGIKKEPKYWNQERLRPRYKKDLLPVPRLSDYLDLFDAAAEEIRGYSITTPEGVHYHPGIVGDFDPMIIWKMPRWNQIKGNLNEKEPKYLTHNHLSSINPNTKIIVLMRNPVERTFSHYKHFVASNDPLRFHNDMVGVLEKLEKCLKWNTVRQCIYHPWGNDTSKVNSVTGGLYEVFLKDWFSVFPRNQFLFIKSEDYFQNRTKTLLEIFHFLEIETPISKETLHEVDALPAAHQSTKLQMKNQTRTMLRDFFIPHERRLEVLLKDNRWRWN